jgi:SagB-type dehydrogenase family enzyme
MNFSPLVLRWRLVPGVSFAPSGETDLTIAFAAGDTATLTPGRAGLRDALLAITDGADEARLLALADGDAPAPLYYYLARLVSRGVLEASADCGQAPVVRLVPRSTLFELPVTAVLPDRVMLDRFACFRRTDRGATLQHPDAVCDLLVEDAACASLIARLMADSLDTRSLTGPLDHALTALLVALGFVVDAAMVEAPARQTWEFHDRLFQRAARSYDDLIVRGETYRFAGKLPAPPTIRTAYVGIPIPLPHPPAGPSSGSQTLHEVMESRRSLRAMSEQPVGLEAIGQLLHRVARVKAVLPGTSKIAQEVVLRPYPSGGAIHELEFYLAVRACAGLAPGFYHYRGQEHTLTQIAGAEAPATAMLADCATAWRQPDRPPQVLVVIASRLPRLAWTYAGIAYKLSLLNAGVAIQSLDLVATDLGLAGSAAGSGNPDLFAQATGVSSWEETSIAEFGFGRPA